MSPRSRHSPLQAASKPSHGSRSSVPEHQAVPDSSSMSFAKSSLNSSVMHSHYALTSSTSGSRHQYDVWSTGSNRMPKDTDFLPMNGYDSMHYIDPYSTDMMTTSDPMELQYNLAAGETLSRHAVSAATAPAVGDIMMNDFMSLDFANCDAVLQDQMDTSSWPYGLPSPPRDDELFQDQALVEDLGPSKLLPYSGNRHAAVQPRPIRPSSERHSAGSRSPELPLTPPKDDYSGKIKARNDPLYDARPDKHGWYHCPLIKEYRCTHQPTKQKCIYAKYLDSHLRPYKCKYATPGDDCEDTRFSSNACLFRHEREAHGKHNHGLNPYLCEWADCERSKSGNGFPRRWNQRDHMKRMHNWIEPDSTPSETRHAVDQSKRRRGPAAPSSVPMRRSESYARTAVPTNVYSSQGRHVAVSRHSAQAPYVNAMHTGSMMTYPVAMDSISYASQPYVSNYYQAVY